jgi:cell division septum initiation protein DivIVA
MAARKKPAPADPVDLIGAAFSAPPSDGPLADDTAQSIGDAMSDDNLRDRDEDEDDLDDDPIEDEGPQAPMEYLEDAEPRVRGRVVPFSEAPLLRMARINTQIPSINVYKSGADGVLVQIGQSPITIGLQGFIRQHFLHMPKPGEPPAVFLARGCNGIGQEVSQEESLPIIDANHSYLVQLRESGFGRTAQGGGAFGIPGMNSLADMQGMIERATANDRLRLEAQIKAADDERKAGVAARERQEAGINALGQRVVEMALAGAKEQTAAATIQAQAQVAAVKESSQGAVAMATSMATQMVEIARADAIKARADSETRIAQMKLELDDRDKDRQRKHDADLERMRSDAKLAEQRMRTESEERIARANADSAQRVAEIKAMAEMRVATAGINANSPSTMLTQGLELLKLIGGDGASPKDALRALTGGSDAEVIVPIVEQVGKLIDTLGATVGKGIVSYMEENTKREALKVQEREAERAALRPQITFPTGFGYATPNAGQIAMAQHPQEPPPNLTPVSGPGAPAGPAQPPPPMPQQAAPQAPTGPAPSTLPLDKQREARMTASAVVDNLRVPAFTRDRWVPMLGDMLQRVPSLGALMRERTIAGVLREAGATPAMLDALLADLNTPAALPVVPADIPRGN